MVSKMKFWRLYCPTAEVRLDITLKCGQSFRWKLLENKDGIIGQQPSGEKFYIGVVKKRLWIVGRDGDDLLYTCVNNPEEKETELKADLEDYLQLKVGLAELYKTWASADPLFAEVAEKYPGVRILRQDPVENVFSFICSANNHISRISSMVENLCTEWGERLACFEGKEYFAFPAIERLAEEGVEERLRELGFGYRAKYIQQSAQRLVSLGGPPWLLGLRDKPLLEARADLMQLAGVGPKVADCILLMSIDQPGSVPVDTHMLNIAKRYLPHLATQKTITAKTHKEVGEHFRSLLGPWAGWAHSVLFSADLKHLQQLKEENSQPQSSNLVKEENILDQQHVLDKVKTESGTDPIVKAEIDERSSNSKVAKNIKRGKAMLDAKSHTGETQAKKMLTKDKKDFPEEEPCKRTPVKAKSKAVKQLKAKALIGEISPFRRKKFKLKT